MTKRAETLKFQKQGKYVHKVCIKVQVNLLEPISGKFSPEQVQAWLSEKFYIEQWKLVFLQK